MKLLVANCVLVLAAACVWNPPVTPVPISAPWAEMNLPINDRAIVWRSTNDEFRVVHQAGKAEVLTQYSKALSSQGWELVDSKDEGSEMSSEMRRGDQKIALRIYDFENTGVVIERR